MNTFNSLFEMLVVTVTVVAVCSGQSFNSLFEMPGVLVFGFCGFLNFCVGVCRFLAEAC
jgi:hypothetical protein